MAHWNEAAVTNTGVELLNEWMAGRKLTITAAYGGTGTVEADKLPEQTGLVNQKQKLSLLGKEDSKTGVTVQVQVNNLGLEEEYELNQVMVMAALDRDKDPDSEEKCLFIMQDQKGVDIPAEDDDEVFLLELYCAIGITNNGRFAASVDTTGIVSISRMTEAIQKALDAHNADQEAHGGILGGQEQQYSAEKTYKAGAYCNKDGKLYKCKEDITEPEEWNPDHWDATTVTKALEGTQVTADEAKETAEKAVDEALEQITTSPEAEELADSDAFATVTAAGIKRTPLSLLKQVLGKLFAPSGFGLGESQGRYIPDDDFNNAIQNGWYLCKGSESNGPDLVNPQYTGNASLFVDTSRTDGVKEQTLHLGTAGLQGLTLRRYYHSSLKAWQVWEWVNPPMQSGVEYRTTERWGSSYVPVYAKTLSIGKGPTAGAKIEVAHGIKDMGYIVDVGGCLTIDGAQAVSLPYYKSDTDRAGIDVNDQNIIVTAKETDLSDYSDTVVWMKYTKTTDGAG